VAASAVWGFTEKSFRAKEVRLNYAEGPASGPPLLLLHGLTRDWRSFSVLLAELSRRFHVYAIDLRGHGSSGHVAGGYRLLEFANDISDFLRSHFPDGAAVFGHSLGAMVAMAAAGSTECHISALVVGDTMITPENFRHSLYTPLFQQLRSLLQRGSSQTELAVGMGKISLRVPGLDELVRIEELPGNTPDVLAEWARTAIRTDPDAIQMTVDGSAFEGWQPEQLLPEISCPTLLLQGNPELDGLLSDEDVKLAMRLVPNTQHVKYPLLGHGLFMQQARPVLNAVTEFLTKFAG